MQQLSPQDDAPPQLTTPPDESRIGGPRGLTGQASRYALFSAIWVFLFGYLSMAIPPGIGRTLVVGLCLVLIISGFWIGIMALLRNRAKRQRGVNGYALVGVLAHMFYITVIVIRLSRMFLS